VPAVRRQALAGLLAQMSQGGADVGIVLVVRNATGSLVWAGVAAAGFAVGAGVARPIQGRFMDRRGPVGVLVASGVIHAAALVVLVGLAELGAPAATLVVVAVAAGLGLPPVSSSMRLAWGRLVGERERVAAYSLITVVQEIAILAGPLLLGVLVALASASVALVAIALVVGAGTIAFAALLGRPAGAVGGNRELRLGVLRSPGMRRVLLVTALLGTSIGAVTVGAPALAHARGADAASGVLVAALSAGGILGGVAYGVRAWGSRLSRRLVGMLVLLAAALAPLAATSSLAAAAALLLVGGIAFNPALTTTTLMVDVHVPARAAEAFGWLSTSMAVGNGAGSAIAGALAHAGGASRAFLAGAVAAGAGAVVAFAARSRLDGAP
jgi:predicted MFS family arabinose efflux permease